MIDDAKAYSLAQIRLSYKAKINANAVVGTTGNVNEVDLKYTNSPDHSGDGEYDDDEWTSVTPKSMVITYVTGIKLLKVDATNPEKHLAGAVFQIEGSRNVSTVVTTKGFTEDSNGTYYKLNDNSYTETAPGGAIPNDDYASTEIKYKATENTVVKTETSAVKVEGTTDASGYLKFDELGAGTYTITEITAPTGYNLLSAPIQFTITFEGPASVTTGNETCTWDKENLSGISSVTFDSAEGVFSIVVEDAQGTTLPSTGGIGTTIFYIVGGLLLVGAAVILVARKKAND
jgi:LPXTG-motif cell wall-anchored protein